MFFPNGMRGDRLSKDYIDLMMEAGTVNLALALETASPRLQQVIGKHLDIDKLYDNMAYICEKYPHVILELFTMHGFPTETEAEAQKTMDFIKSLKWLHLPHVNILKIFPNTEMADLAIKHGISADAIARSEHLAFHELPETLPFDRSFTLKYQSDYLDYFLSKERLLHVLPHQMKVLTRDEILQKYNSFLPTEINRFEDLLNLARITAEEFGPMNFLDEEAFAVPGLDEKIKAHFSGKSIEDGSLKVLLLDLSQYFSHESHMLYDVSEPPLGLVYLLTYLQEKFSSKIHGKIIKSRRDFDSFEDLKAILAAFKPDVIGIRTLTFFNDFFHRTTAMIRNWGYEGPLVAGGPYATSDYRRILYDKNVDLVVLGEGEITFAEFIEKFMDNHREIPGDDVLKEIAGIAFIPRSEKQNNQQGREIIMVDQLQSHQLPPQSPAQKPEKVSRSNSLVYTMFTSGSTGKPKAVAVEHRSVVRLVKNSNFVKLSDNERILQAAPLEFDASTFEIWSALLRGTQLVVLDKDKLLSGELKAIIGKHKISTMWITAPLFNKLVEIFSGG